MVWTYDGKLAESQDPRIQAALQRVYRQLWPGSIIANIHAIVDPLLQQHGQDIRVRLRAPSNRPEVELSILETVEEKIRSPRASVYGDLLVETESCRERGTAGWVYTSRADWLSYVRQPKLGELCVWILPMQELRSWFTGRADRFPHEIKTTTERYDGSAYTTICRIVPRSDAAFMAFWNAHGCREVKTHV